MTLSVANYYFSGVKVPFMIDIQGAPTMYRPQIKVCDCNHPRWRLMNNSKFSLEEVRNVYAACPPPGSILSNLDIGTAKSFFSPQDTVSGRFLRRGHA